MKHKKLLTIVILLMILNSGCLQQEKGGESFGEMEQTKKMKTELGISVLPKGELWEWTDKSFTEAFQKTEEGYISVAIWRHQWGDIETSLGNYKWSDIDYEIYKTEGQGLKYSLVIEVIHTNILGRYPKDISFTKFDDPFFVDSFKDFIGELLNRYPDKINYLWIGNEVDWYLHNNPEQITPFLNLYQEVEEEIKSIDPDIIVGIVGAYHLARNNDEIKLLQDFAERGDAIALTLYMEDDHENPDVSDTQSYFDELISLFPNKKIAIIETAWSSAGPKGSEEKQAEYVKEIAKVIDKHGDRFVFFSWFVLYDFPEHLNREIAESFGVPIDTEAGKQFLNWQGSLGLLNNNGTEKLAWNVWKQYMFVHLALPHNRSFYMGMTPWPYDFTPKAVEETYKTIDKHTDLIAHHFDDGVPWPEALAGKPYHSNVMGEIDFRVSHLQKYQKVYLAVTPISIFRDSLAGYWAEDTNMEMPDDWKGKDFDDPDVITAYTNFCRYMIQRFNPDYMAYGIEVNILAESNPDAFKKYLVMTEQVYKTLKKENPNLPLFLTIQLDNFVKNKKKQNEIVRQLLPFTDYIAVSSYPYTEKANPHDLPEDWFSQIRNLAPEKPFAVAETGFIAENLVLEKYKVRIQGREEWQAEYVQFLLSESNRLDAEFVVWFVSRDYDSGWIKLENMGLDEFFKLWRDTGLLDGEGKSRKSLQIWDAWLGLPKEMFLNFSCHNSLCMICMFI